MKKLFSFLFMFFFISSLTFSFTAQKDSTKKTHWKINDKKVAEGQTIFYINYSNGMPMYEIWYVEFSEFNKKPIIEFREYGIKENPKKPPSLYIESLRRYTLNDNQIITLPPETELEYITFKIKEFNDKTKEIYVERIL